MHYFWSDDIVWCYHQPFCCKPYLFSDISQELADWHILLVLELHTNYLFELLYLSMNCAFSSKRSLWSVMYSTQLIPI